MAWCGATPACVEGADRPGEDGRGCRERNVVVRGWNESVGKVGAGIILG
jgi:hypothetical protein